MVMALALGLGVTNALAIPSWMGVYGVTERHRGYR